MLDKTIVNIIMYLHNVFMDVFIFFVSVIVWPSCSNRGTWLLEAVTL